MFELSKTLTPIRYYAFICFRENIGKERNSLPFVFHPYSLFYFLLLKPLFFNLFLRKNAKKMVNGIDHDRS